MRRSLHPEAERIVSGGVPGLQAVPHVVAAWLFGSVGRGDFGAASDMDVAVLLDEEAYHADAGIASVADVQRALLRVTSRDVDVVVLNDAAPALVQRVLREGALLIGEDDPRRVTFETRALAEAMDFQFYLERYDRLLLDRAREGRLGA